MRACPVWRLVSPKPFPRIHVLSDIRLETGPYAIPGDLEFDVLVAAGDIGPVPRSIEWLASIGKPVIYILGNHEFYGREFGDVLPTARAAAQGTQVHVLERDRAVVHGVRFLGATLWTSYYHLHPALVNVALRRMNDFNYIRASRWYESRRNRTKLRQYCRWAGINPPPDKTLRDEPLFHPAIAYFEHQEALKWLRHAMDRPFSGPTVVVTHHAPTFDALRASGVSEELLQEHAWAVRQSDHGVLRVAGYASPLEPILRDYRYTIDAWIHGHLHTSVDIATEGVRIVCNPRGYARTALSRAAAATLFMPPTPEVTRERKEERPEGRYPGNGVGFNARFIVDLEDGLRPALSKALVPIQKKLCAVLDDVRNLGPFLIGHDSIPDRSVHRCLVEDVQRFEAILHVVMKLASNLDPHAPQALLSSLARPAALPWIGQHGDANDSETPNHDVVADLIACMEAWITWTAALPCAASNDLVQWAQNASYILEEFRLRGVSARVRRPPVDALRSLVLKDTYHFYADATEKQCEELEWNLRARVEKREQMFWTLVRPLSTVTASDRRLLLSERKLRAMWDSKTSRPIPVRRDDISS